MLKNGVLIMPKINLKQQAIHLIEQLPTQQLEVIVDYLTYLQDKEAWEATHELTSNPEIVESLKKAEADIKADRLKNWNDVRRDV